MSVYAFDSGQRQLMVVWPAGVGSAARSVAAIPIDLADSRVSELCAALTMLSDTIWATYVRPPSAAVNDEERGHREAERAGRDQVLATLRSPNLVDDFGILSVSYVAIEEAAHRLARTLLGIGDPTLTETIIADVVAELDAVTNAELGDLSDRAAQATALDRLDVSPVQVAAADDLLRADLLGPGLLTALIDPAAACVAAARWLVAAAVVAAEAVEIDAASVFAEADDIEPVSGAVPAEVVAQIVDDETDPRSVVLDLLRTAVAAGDGVILDLSQLLAQHRGQLGLSTEEQSEVAGPTSVRATELDPRRPARDLLEHLLDGIAACHLLYAEYDDDPDEPRDDDRNDEPNPDAEASRRDRTAEEFTQLVRARAAQGNG